MKLYYFSITFFVVNVLADNEAQYRRIVAKTNAAIKLAYDASVLTVDENSQANELEYVIERILNVHFFEASCFAEINLMIAVPDQVDLIYCIPGGAYSPAYEDLKWSALMGIQDRIREVIRNILGFALPGAKAARDFGSLNLTTLAEMRRPFVESALKNIFTREFGSMYDHFIFQLEIRDTINVDRLNLTTLVENRRVTGRSLENVIRRVVGTGDPESNEAVEDQIDEEVSFNLDIGRSKNGPPLLRLCRLMALYMSTKFPTSYIKKLWINIIDNTCCLDDGNLKRRLKQINGIWWQISSISSVADNIV